MSKNSSSSSSTTTTTSSDTDTKIIECPASTIWELIESLIEILETGRYEIRKSGRFEDFQCSSKGEVIEIPILKCEAFRIENLRVVVTKDSKIRIIISLLQGTFPHSFIASKSDVVRLVQIEIKKYTNQELFTIEKLRVYLSKDNVLSISMNRLKTSLSFERLPTAIWQPNLPKIRSTRVRIESFSSRITHVSSQIDHLLLQCQNLSLHFDTEETKSLRLRISNIQGSLFQVYAITNVLEKIQIARIRFVKISGGQHQTIPTTSSQPLVPSTLSTAATISSNTSTTFSMLTASLLKQPRGNTILNTLNRAFSSQKAWKKRYFTLSRFALTYYEDSGSSRPLGRIELRERILARLVNESEFEIVIDKSRLLHVRAQSSIQAKRWIQEINLRSAEFREKEKEQKSYDINDDVRHLSLQDVDVLRHISFKCQDVELYVSVKELYELLFSFASRSISVIDLVSRFFERSFFCHVSVQVQNLRIMLRRTVRDSKIAMRLETRLVRAENIELKKVWKTKVSDVTVSYFNESNYAWEPVLHVESSELTTKMSDLHIRCLNRVSLHLSFQFLSALRNFRFDSLSSSSASENVLTSSSSSSSSSSSKINEEENSIKVKSSYSVRILNHTGDTVQVQLDSSSSENNRNNQAKTISSLGFVDLLLHPTKNSKMKNFTLTVTIKGFSSCRIWPFRSNNATTPRRRYLRGPNGLVSVLGWTVRTNGKQETIIDLKSLIGVKNECDENIIVRFDRECNTFVSPRDRGVNIASGDIWYVPVSYGCRGVIFLACGDDNYDWGEFLESCPNRKNSESSTILQSCLSRSVSEDEIHTSSTTLSCLDVNIEDDTKREYRCISRRLSDDDDDNDDSDDKHPSWLGSKSEEDSKRVRFLRQLVALDLPIPTTESEFHAARMYKDTENTSQYDTEQWLEYLSTTKRTRQHEQPQNSRELIAIVEQSIITITSPIIIHNNLPVDLQTHFKSSINTTISRLIRPKSSIQIKEFDLLHNLVLSLQLKDTQRSEQVTFTTTTNTTTFLDIPLRESPTVLTPLRLRLDYSSPRSIRVSCAVILENPYDLPIQIQCLKGGAYEISSRLWIAGHENCSLRIHTSSWTKLRHIVQSVDLSLPDTFEKDREFRVHLKMSSKQIVTLTPHLIIVNNTSRDLFVRKNKKLHRLEAKKNFIVWWGAKKEDNLYQFGWQNIWTGDICLARETDPTPVTISKDFDLTVAVNLLEQGGGTFVASLEERKMIRLNNQNSEHDVMYWQEYTDARRWGPRLVSRGTLSSVSVFEPIFPSAQFILFVGSSEMGVRLTWPFVSGLFRSEVILPKMSKCKCETCVLSSSSSSVLRFEHLRYDHPSRFWFVSERRGFFCDHTRFRAESNLGSYVAFERVHSCRRSSSSSIYTDNNNSTDNNNTDNMIRYGDLVRICLYKEKNRKLAISEETSSSGIFGTGDTRRMLCWSLNTHSIFRVCQQEALSSSKKNTLKNNDIFVLQSTEYPKLFIGLYDSKPCLTSTVHHIVAISARFPFEGNNEEHNNVTVEMQRNADNTSNITLSTSPSSSSSFSSKHLTRRRKQCILEIQRFEISVIDKDLKELMLCTSEGMNATCVMETLKSERRGMFYLNLRTNSVQIDSMIHEKESRSNVVFQPTFSSKDEPFFSLLLDGEWHTRSNTIVWWTNEIYTRLAELEFRHCPELLICLDQMYASIGTFQGMSSKIVSSRILASRLSVEPLQINLSFDVDNNTFSLVESTSLSVLAPILKILHALKRLVGSVRRAPLTLDGFYVANVHNTMDNTVSSMTRHFSSELLSALYKTAGSMQVLGNPVGVFRAFRDGVRGFVSHTYTGVVGGRGIGTGLREGSIELLRGATHGLSLATSSLTGSVVRGVSALHFENEEEEEQEGKNEEEEKEDEDDDDETRERVRQSLLSELQIGAELLSQGLIDGASGVVRAPIRGAKRDGIGGFLRGVGEGLVGAVVRPTTGVAEFVNRPLVAIADMSSSVELQRGRRRSPRCFPRRSADGSRVVVLLRQGERLVRRVRMERGEDYVDHVEIVLLDRMYVLLVTSERVLLLSEDTAVRTHWVVRRGNVKMSIEDTIRHVRNLNDRIRGVENDIWKYSVTNKEEEEDDLTHFHELSLEKDRTFNLCAVRKVVNALNDKKKLSADDLLPILTRMVCNITRSSKTVVYVAEIMSFVDSVAASTITGPESYCHTLLMSCVKKACDLCLQSE